MKTNFPERIVEMLRGSPEGLTAKDIAERLGTTAGNISSRLSKLAAYGIIGKGRSASVRPGLRGTLYQALSDDALPQRSRAPSRETAASSCRGSANLQSIAALW